MSLKLSDKWSLEGFLESGREHIGKQLDRQNIFNLLMTGGVAYFGYRGAEKAYRIQIAPELDKIEDEKRILLNILPHTVEEGRALEAKFADIEKRKAELLNKFPSELALGGVTTALIGMKLATTFGGTPPVSQIAGLAILVSIGLLNWDLFKKTFTDILDLSPLHKKIEDEVIAPSRDRCLAMGGTFYEVGVFGANSACRLKDGSWVINP